MPVFAYIAHASGQREGGTLVADSAREARDLLRDRGLDLESLVPQDKRAAQADKTKVGPDEGGAPSRSWSMDWAMLGRRPDTSGFLRELATLVEVGVPVLDALDVLIGQQPARAARFKAVLQGVRDRVASGRSLADALADARLFQRASVFDSATVAMVRVGQEIGRLGEVLSRVADYQERRAGMKNRLLGAMTYPAVVGVFGLGVCLFLMTNVVPDILEALADSGRALPWPTCLVKGFSDALITQGPWLLLAFGVVVAVVVALLSRPAGRLAFDRWLLSVPLVGEIIRKQSVVRLAFLLSTLLANGVSFERAMGIARAAVNNRVLRDALERCEQAVHEGRDLGSALALTRAFPETVVKVFDLGQASGRLAELLERLATSYDRQVATLTERLTTILEPVLIVCLAILVGLIAFATLLPVLEIGNAL